MPGLSFPTIAWWQKRPVKKSKLMDDTENGRQGYRSFKTKPIEMTTRDWGIFRENWRVVRRTCTAAVTRDFLNDRQLSLPGLVGVAGIPLKMSCTTRVNAYSTAGHSIGLLTAGLIRLPETGSGRDWLPLEYPCCITSCCYLQILDRVAEDGPIVWW
jgi:hypothetical protein